MINIGARVKVKDQEITGVVVRYDCGSKVVVLDDDRADWAEEQDEGVLVFNVSELEEAEK